MWLRTLLILLLIAFLIRAFGRLLRGVMEGASTGTSGRARPAHPTPVKMVADPICGTFVVPGKALQLASGRETIYFCSEKCRDQWAVLH
jgi:YHS domain-containing protein